MRMGRYTKLAALPQKIGIRLSLRETFHASVGDALEAAAVKTNPWKIASNFICDEAGMIAVEYGIIAMALLAAITPACVYVTPGLHQ